MQHDNASKAPKARGRVRRRFPLKTLVVLGGLVPLMHLRAFDPAGVARPTATPWAAFSLERNAMDFWATAYCESGITRSGVPAAPGMVAADPKVLPLGSIIFVHEPVYAGFYQVMDTGRLVKGRTIDVYIPDLQLAVEFGRKRVRVTVLHRGFPPRPLEPAE